MIPLWMTCVLSVLCGMFGASLVYQYRRTCAMKARLQQLGRQAARDAGAALSTDDLARLCILLQVPGYDVQQIQDELRRSSIEHFVTAGPIEEEDTG